MPLRLTGVVLFVAWAMLMLTSRGFAQPSRQGKSSHAQQPTTATKPSVQPQQQQNLAKLKTDLQTIHAKSSVTPAQVQAVANDLMAIFSTANRPSKQSVQKLAKDLTAIVADRKITPTEAYKLSQDVAAVLASANISQGAVDKLLADIQILLKATNITQTDLQTIKADVKAIVDTARSNKPVNSRKTKR